MFNAADYTADELGLRCVDKMVAAITKLDGALEIFGTVVSTPSKNESERTAAGALALRRVGELVVRVAAKPLLSTLPGGGALYETLKSGLKLRGDVGVAGRAAGKAAAANRLKDFTTEYREQVTNARADLEASRQEVKVAVRRDVAELESKDARDSRKLELFALGSRLDSALSGELSVASLFTRIVSEWMNQAPPTELGRNRLIVKLAEDWSLITGFLNGPSGDRCAEQLMKLHGGSLNVRGLGLPIEVRWFLGTAKNPSKSYVSARLAPDGTLLQTSAYEIWKKERAQIEIRKRLESNGIPPVTRLEGSKT